MKTFIVNILSPDYEISFIDTSYLIGEGIEGRFMILHNHAPYLIYLLPSMITVCMRTQVQKFTLSNRSILKVVNNVCRIMTSTIQSV
ncbi:F0F1 ATP synthase subunit epsilon [Wolbachia endosymbiont of Howardula sp.]|uniref:F0F1 ATP synthase subunit epsilon n=1 Tax=Wolbachia endosymbiont of Howardula sp. TaxID=2916816 RepID=UPI00217D8A4A|nr:F0F1 ATP synthase subunit epsilon [Wolbachia endosymbiont of Howardula sp.]UWI83173.1 F0F1 ATP synthase subunit epsilon [Wolbachia endosymbiont of Howardula sp.]